MSHTEFNRNRSKRKSETAKSIAVRASTIDPRPICQVTTAIKASEATITPSRNAPAILDSRIRGKRGPLAATNRNAGRKIPTVATTAPRVPYKKRPKKVAGGKQDRE